MKAISMVDLRTKSESIGRQLKRGERMILSYRGKALAELVPAALAAPKLTPLEALHQAQELTAQDANAAYETERYVRELREDQRKWSERGGS
jgi:antitoxin (DNA-binding transcriptional repressor) of toxin-antitoxin stability system